MPSSADMQDPSVDHNGSPSMWSDEPRADRPTARSSMFDEPDEDDPSGMASTIRKLQAEVRRLDRRIDNLGASTAYNVDAMQQARERQRAPQQHRIDEELEAMRRAASLRFDSVEKHIDAVMRANAELGERLARAEKAQAAFAGSDAAHTSRAPKFSPPYEERPRRSAREDDAHAASRQAYAKHNQVTQARSRNGDSIAPGADEPSMGWGKPSNRHTAEPDRGWGRPHGVSPTRTIRARSRSPAPYQRMMHEEPSYPSASARPRSPGPYMRTMHADDDRRSVSSAQPHRGNPGAPDVWSLMSAQWESDLSQPKSFFALAGILCANVNREKEVYTEVIHGALRTALGEQMFYEIMDGCGGLQRYFASASKFLKIAKSPLGDEVVLFSGEKHCPFHEHDDNQAYFARVAASAPPRRSRSRALSEYAPSAEPRFTGRSQAPSEPRFAPHAEPRYQPPTGPPFQPPNEPEPQFARPAPPHLHPQRQALLQSSGGAPLRQTQSNDGGDGGGGGAPRVTGWATRAAKLQQTQSQYQSQGSSWGARGKGDPGAAAGWGDEPQAPQARVQRQSQSHCGDSVAAAETDASADGWGADLQPQRQQQPEPQSQSRAGPEPRIQSNGSGNGATVDEFAAGWAE